MKALRNLWRQSTGDESTPLEGDAPAWLVSLLVHMVLLIALGLMGWKLFDNADLTLVVNDKPPEEEKLLEELQPKEFEVSDQDVEEIGAMSLNGEFMAESLAQILDVPTDVPQPITEELATNPIQALEVPLPTGLNYSDTLNVKGAYGQGTTGAAGAINWLTKQIKLSLEQRPTTVIWLFDESYSLNRQRAEVLKLFDQVYKELSVIEASEHKSFKQHADAGVKPLLTTVYSFGKNYTERLPKPTDSLPEIKAAVASISNDPSGEENTFSTVYAAVDKYKAHTQLRPKRNVMIVLFTDEVGDDQNKGLDPTIAMCLKYAVPVYVIGVPAPFGRDKIEVKWVDPDPKYDQSPQWGEVVQGPESFMPERIKLRFGKQDDEPIDSGFGPYALSRLGYETGGTYHRVHSRLTQVDKKVTKKDTENLSSYLARFFDPKVMAPYRPDYVTIKEYQKLLADNKARESLVRAAHASWVTTMDSPRLTFPKKSEADLANIVTEAQKLAARLTPQINGLCGLLEQGVEDREQETKPRWKAGYDLAMGRVLAAKVRTEAYNLMLAQLKTGMQFKGADSDTWELVPADEITVGSALDRQAKQAREYLNRVVEQHEGTPWAYLAKKELEEPIGWKWTEKHTGVMAPKVAMGGGNAAPPRNDEKKMLKKPPPRRAVPKL